MLSLQQNIFLQLFASVLMKDPVTVCKAKSLLEKALAQDETYLPAVYLLTEILEQVRTFVVRCSNI